MAYQRGSIARKSRKGGDIWVLRYRVSTADGRRVENTLPIGLVRDFPTEKAAWREADKLGLLVRINCDAPSPARIRFDALAEFYLRADFGEDAMRPKTEGTTLNTQQIVHGHLVPRWGREIAEDIKPLDIQRWLKSLHTDKGLAWTTCSKVRGVMLRAYKTGILHELVTKNPVLPVETRSKTHYRAIMVTPQQTREILRILSSPLHRILIYTCAATALRSSELLALRWADIRFDEARIRVSKRWSRGKDGATKTEGSDGYVPLHSRLARHLQAWRTRTPYWRDTDFVFPSFRENGRIPLSPAVFVADHLRKAALQAGVAIPEGHRFGLHNLRHSLSNWMVNKGKVEPKTVQGILRHSRIQTTLDLYTQQDSDEARAAQGAYLKALGTRPGMVQ
jgi:integrase